MRKPNPVFGFITALMNNTDWGEFTENEFCVPIDEPERVKYEFTNFVHNRCRMSEVNFFRGIGRAVVLIPALETTILLPGEE